MKRLLLLLLTAIVFSCGDEDEPETNPPPEPTTKKITIDPSITYQEMVGFGGALTWYSDRMISSANKNAIAQLLFEDLGTDIVRFQAFYYPNDYPDYKGTANMSYDNSAALFNTTNQIYNLKNDYDPDIKVLLSSWGPPRALKSNDNEREGTLKKDDDGFMYDEFAQYWEDILDNVPFNPDYISIQNEPTYSNPGWTTCVWSATENTNYPSYMTAFDAVHDKIKDRTYVPVMIGPESQDLLSPFTSFANLLKDKPHCGILGYHPYNINSGTTSSQIDFLLNAVAGYNTKPNLMTEFSDNLNWFSTAMFINSTLTKANSSGYIYWKMVWATPTGTNPDVAMISINQNGNYTVTPYFHLMKHFSKDINAGHQRIEVTSENTSLSVSGFMNEAEDQVTLIVINSGTQATLDLEVKNGTINTIKAVQSKEGSYYQTVEGVSVDKSVVFPSQSITTITLGI